MKAKSIILLGFFSFALASSFISCGGAGSKTGETGKGSEPPVPPEPPVTSEECLDIAKMIVYIDASASIKGYFSDGSDGKFGNAITNLAQYKGLNSPVYFWGKNTKKTKVSTSVDASGGVNAALRSKSGYGQDSYFNEMFKQMVNLIKNDSVDAACLVTDGIYGVGNDLTNKDIEHAKKTLDNIERRISEFKSFQKDVQDAEKIYLRKLLSDIKILFYIYSGRIMKRQTQKHRGSNQTTLLGDARRLRCLGVHL